MANQPWPLSRIVSKVQDDLDLHEENFVTPDDIKQYINDAIDDAEELIIDCFSDHFLTYKLLEVTADDTLLELPEDLYESRIRGFWYSTVGFESLEPTGDAYKVKKLKLERIKDVSSQDCYQYRLFNSSQQGQRLKIFPAIREDSDDRFLLCYIRQAKRLYENSDELEKGIRIQYVLTHVKKSVASKIGDPMLEEYAKKLEVQSEKLKKSLSRLTDDDEDDYLEPDDYAMSEAYGYDDYF